VIRAPSLVTIIIVLPYSFLYGNCAVWPFFLLQLVVIFLSSFLVGLQKMGVCGDFADGHLRLF
jgi:hypothetical protein